MRRPGVRRRRQNRRAAGRRGGVQRIGHRAAGGGVAGQIRDLGGQQVAAIAERDVGAPGAAADGGDADLGRAIENGDRGAGIGASNRSAKGQARLVGRTTRVADRHLRCGGVERDHVGRSGRAIARRIAELGRDRLGAVGPEVAGGHRQADAAGRHIGGGDGVGHRMRQRRTAEQQLNRIAGRNRRIERHREGRRRHIGDAVSMRRPGVRRRGQNRRAAARRGGVERDGQCRGGRAVAKGVAELRRNLLAAVGPEVAGGHRQADAAGRHIGGGDDVRHRMRQRRTAEQQLNRIAGHDR